MESQLEVRRRKEKVSERQYFAHFQSNFLILDRSSVTRFGKVLPIWILEIFGGLFLNLQNVEPTLSTL